MKWVLFCSIVVVASKLFAGVLDPASSSSGGYFTPNEGQWSSEVLFLSRTADADCWFTDDGIRFCFLRPLSAPEGLNQVFSPYLESEEATVFERLVISTSFLDASREAVISGEGLLSHRSNFFLGDDPSLWRTDVPEYSRLVYNGLYPEVDVIYQPGSSSIEYDIVVHPGGRIADFRIQYEGVSSLSISEHGALLIETPWGTLTEEMPLVYQEVDDVLVRVEAGYAVDSHGSVGFKVGSYDPEIDLIIDPTVELSFSSYLGGSATDYPYGAALSGQNAVITGYTNSADFPLESAIQDTIHGETDVFITGFDPIQQEMMFSTYLGGTQADYGRGIASDEAGCIYIAGNTFSSNYPTVNPYQSQNIGSCDVFVSKLSPTGNQLLYSTYIGGSAADFAWDVAVDAESNAYISGYSSSSDYPLVNPFQTQNDIQTIIVTKLNNTGNVLCYSTFLGCGQSGGNGWAIAVDSQQRASVTGFTWEEDFPLQNPIQSSIQGLCDAFLTTFTQEGNEVVFSSYLGGSSMDEGRGIAIGPDDCATITGSTGSSDFPTLNPFQPVMVGTKDAFVTRVDPLTAEIIFSTFLGGAGGIDEEACAVFVDETGSAFVTGRAGTGFPLLNPWQETYGGEYDAFVTRFTPWGDTIFYSTYLGGSGTDFGMGIVADSLGYAFVTGRTSSTDFPVMNAFQGYGGGEFDGFVAVFNPEGSPVLNHDFSPVQTSTMLSVSPNPFGSTLHIEILPGAEPVEVHLLDLAGRRIETLNPGYVAEGIHCFQWDPAGYPCGVYFVEARAGDGILALEKVILLR